MKYIFFSRGNIYYNIAVGQLGAVGIRPYYQAVGKGQVKVCLAFPGIGKEKRWEYLAWRQLVKTTHRFQFISEEMPTLTPTTGKDSC